MNTWVRVIHQIAPTSGRSIIAGGLFILGSLLSLTLVADDPAPAPGEEPPEPPGEAAVVSAPLEITLNDQWTVLYKAGRSRPEVMPFPEKGPLQSIPKFTLTGAMEGHPFGLGEFHADGTWGISQGVVTVVAEKNALLRLTAADQFELEGLVTQEGTGGWFLLFGWNQEHGYSLSNFVLRDSPSPWFFTEYSASKAIPDTNQDIKKYEWRGEQPLRMSIVNQQLNLTVGETVIAKEFPLDNYSPGEVFLGTYDTRYGPRKVAVKSLRVRDPTFVKEKAVKPKQGQQPQKK